jgi:hypothetical protein
MRSALPKCHSAVLKYRFYHSSEESPNPHQHQQQSRL